MKDVLPVLDENAPPPTCLQAVGNNRSITEQGVRRLWPYGEHDIVIWTEPALFETNINLNEKSVHDRFWQDIEPGEVLLDIGAAYGGYTLPALAMGASFAICFSPENYDEILYKNLVLNGWQNRAFIYDFGLWSDCGYVTPNNPHMPRFARSIPPGSDPGDWFPVYTLDEIFLETQLARVGASRIDWIKIDTEGAECEILRGGQHLLRTHRPRLLVENHEFKSASIADDTAHILKDLGFAETHRVPYLPGVSHSLYVPTAGR